MWSLSHHIIASMKETEWISYTHVEKHKDFA